MAEMILEKSRPVFRGHGKLYYGAGLALAFFLGMAAANGFATRQALDDAWYQCHLTLKSDMQRLQHNPGRQ